MQLDLDYIFIIGPSAVGKTTLAKALYQQCGGVYLELSMTPEFTIPPNCPDEGVFEEELCWQNTLQQIDWFHRRGFHNIVALDFDDVRARELPLQFRGSRFAILRLFCSDPAQIEAQMEYRHTHEGGLYAPQDVRRTNAKIAARPPLPNEILLDVAGMSRQAVLDRALALLCAHTPQLAYTYQLDDERRYLSWVQSKNLR